MIAFTATDAEVLIPNSDHKNFTFGGKIIPDGTKIEGKEEYIAGLRRGQPFIYRLFKTNEGQYISLNQIKPMQTTEVKLGADAAQSKTVINMKPAETYSKLKTTAVIVGASAGFVYSKFYKKEDMKKNIMWASIGAVIGYATGYILDSRKDVVVNPSK